MTGGSPAEQPRTGFDRVLGFTVPDRSVRGRLLRIGPVLDTVLSAHEYSPAIKHVLAEALLLTALMGSLLKDKRGQLTVQAQASGGLIDLLVCDYREGEVRGYVQQSETSGEPVGSNPSLESLFGEGYLAITFDMQTSGERYQGIVPLEGRTLTEACERYFERSEQVPTVLRAGVRTTATGCVAGGLLVQHLPDGEEGRERLHVRSEHPNPDWEHIAVLAGSIRHDELVDPALQMEELAWRLFHEEDEVRVEPMATLTRGCRCTVEHYRQVLAQFAEAERADMRNEDGVIPVDCAFCSKILLVNA